MAAHPRALALTLASILTSSDVTAASLSHWPAFPFFPERFDSPIVRAWSIPYGPDEIDLAPRGLFQAYHVVRETPGQWVAFALFNDSTLVVDLRSHLFVLELEDGGTVSSTDAFASSASAALQPIRLQSSPVVYPRGGAVAISPGGVWRKQFHGGNVATVLFALFPFSRDSTRAQYDNRPWRLEDVVRVRANTSP